jgi:hypothetical protein
MRFDVEPSVKVGVLVSPSLNDVAKALNYVRTSVQLI